MNEIIVLDDSDEEEKVINQKWTSGMNLTNNDVVYW